MRSTGFTIKCTSIGAVMPESRRALQIGAPNVRFGTWCLSITSKCTTSAPASTLATSSADGQNQRREWMVQCENLSYRPRSELNASCTQWWPPFYLSWSQSSDVTEAGREIHQAATSHACDEVRLKSAKSSSTLLRPAPLRLMVRLALTTLSCTAIQTASMGGVVSLEISTEIPRSLRFSRRYRVTQLDRLR
nr:dam methylase [Vibrio cholerae]